METVIIGALSAVVGLMYAVMMFVTIYRAERRNEAIRNERYNRN